MLAATPASLRIGPKIRVFVVDESSHDPLRGVAVRIGITHRDRQQPFEVALGILCSDHAGYLSLRVPSEIGALRAIERVWLDPNLEPEKRVDITQHFAGGLGGNTPFALRIDTQQWSIPMRPRFPSNPEPDVLDWQLSPSSFGSSSIAVIGEDGCERILPSNVAERFFKFSQILRTPQVHPEQLRRVDTSPNTPASDRAFLEFRRGKLVEYEMVWRPAGHGLGEILYSLTLAPCEKVNIAVIDWSRDDTATRGETTASDENLLHDQRRDRLIEESVEAALAEWQTGESFMGGTGGTGGYGGGGMGQMWGVTGSHSLGYATASTRGNREVEVDTVQQIADRITQASSLARSLRSTIITQSTQRESERIQTRVVANHNHCHALTILYYQVVRHYLVTTVLSREHELLFIRGRPHSFDRDEVLRNAAILKRALLDQRFATAFDALERAAQLESLRARQRQIQDDIRAGHISQLIVRVDIDQLTGHGSSRLARERLLLILATDNGQMLSFSFDTDATYNHHFVGRTRVINQPFANPEEAGNPPTATTAVFRMRSMMTISAIREIGLAFNVEGDERHKLEVNRLTIRAVVNDRTYELLQTSEKYFFRSDGEWWHRPNRLPAALNTADEQLNRAQDLLQHLRDNAAHYNAILWMNENPLERARRFSEYLYETTDSNGERRTGVLSDFIDNTPLGVYGEYVVFRITGSAAPLAQGTNTVRSERVISMPTRGTFAEARLSTCNGCEEIDDSRFWDFQQSPCPGEAPSIGAVVPGSRSRDHTLVPTDMGSPGVGIQTPPNLPEPFGLREVMQLLRSPDIFRDMSGIQQLSPLLEKLVEVAGQVEQARIAKLDAGYERRREGNEAAGEGSPQRNSSPSSTGAQGVSRQARAYRGAVERALQDRRITPEQANELTYHNLQRLSPAPVLDSSTIRDLIDNMGTGSNPGRLSFSHGVENFELDTRPHLTEVDYTPSDMRRVRRRYENFESNEEPFYWDITEVVVPMTETYAAFRESVARALGREMYFRSDSGSTVEAMIDLHPDLRDIWNGLTTVGFTPGVSVRIETYLQRRWHQTPTQRWVVAIRFAFAFRREYLEESRVTGDASTGRRNRVQRNMERLNGLLSRLDNEPRNRISCLLALARANDLGFQNTDDLVYLNPLAVALFIDMSAARKADELRNGLPPDRYKVNAILNMLLLLPDGSTDEQLLDRARVIDQNILDSLHVWRRALRSGSNVYSPEFYLLRDWVARQQGTPGTVYYCYGGSSSGGSILSLFDIV